MISGTWVVGEMMKQVDPIVQITIEDETTSSNPHARLLKHAVSPLPHTALMIKERISKSSCKLYDVVSSVLAHHFL